MDDLWIGLHEWDEDRSEFGVPPCELDSQGGEYEVEVTPVLEVSGAEEGGPEASICECPLGDRLRDGALPCSGKPIQPVDWRLSEVRCPVLNLVQNDSPGSLEATPATTMAIFRLLCTVDIVKDSRISCRKFGKALATENTKPNVLTWVLPRGYFICPDAKEGHSLSV